MWNVIVNLIEEIKICEQVGATMSAVSMAFVCIDTMTFLSLPPGKKRQDKRDFMRWVDTYLKGHKDQPYQYRGLDVYAARCAVLHMLGSASNFHGSNSDAKKFAFHDGGKHIYDPATDDTLVVIGTASFIDDVVRAANNFLEACLADPSLRCCVEKRLPRVLSIFPTKTLVE
jgi:hypothetical protein